MDITWHSLTQLSAMLARKELSSVELTQHFLNRISEYDKDLNAFIHVDESRALAQAEQADQQLKAGSADPLCGIPIAHKDIFMTQGMQTTCGSRMLEQFEAPYSATAVRKLAEKGVVTLGKTNMDEFAMGSSNETSYFGPVKNPWDNAYVPGGSSGGSAAAVAAGLALAATGTDTGGSIRQPAALTGITGIKPTYGRVSRFGMIAFASSLDQGGIMTRSAEDAWWLLAAMTGFDPADSTSLDAPLAPPENLDEDSVSGLRIGLPKTFFDKGLDADVKVAVEAALKKYEALGATLVELDMPGLGLSVPTYYVVAPAEASSNLARFDGVRYGHRCDNPKDLNDLYFRSRGEGFGEEVKRRILTGTYVLSAGYYDAYYLKAQKVRQVIAQEFAQAFEQVDVIMGPTTPTAAFKIGEKTSDPITMYLNDIYTIGANLAGLPAMSIPCGFANDLPVGLHLVGPHLAEEKLLRTAHVYQCHSEWHKQHPQGF